MAIQTTFSISDLENLSGIKAHTIRMWEKRYNLLTPVRSETNIRSYHTESLQKMLSVSFLIKNGFKISKVSNLTSQEMDEVVSEVVERSGKVKHDDSEFILSMFNFDRQKFNNHFEKLSEERTFDQIFFEIFLPLLETLGRLWMTNTIVPAHEHFISNLIKQKLLLNIEKNAVPEPKNSKAFVLFLPLNEIHELGLLFIHFKFLQKGRNSIYLGSSVEPNDLLQLQAAFSKIEFVSFFTVSPSESGILPYLEEMQRTVLNLRGEPFHVMGRKTRNLNQLELPSNICHYSSIQEFLLKIGIDN